MGTITGQEWLVKVLKNDATLNGLGVTGVHAGDAPLDADYPLIEVRFVSGVPLMNNGAAIIWFDEVYDVKCVDKREGWGTAIPIADRILALLHNKFDQVQGTGLMIGCSVEDKLQFTEMDGSVKYIHMGYSFRVFTR